MDGDHRIARIIAVQVVAAMVGDAALWNSGVKLVVIGISALHLLGILLIRHKYFLPAFAGKQHVFVMSFYSALTAAIVSLFWFEPGGARWTGFMAYPTSLPFDVTGIQMWIRGGVAAIAVVIAVVVLDGVEKRLWVRNPRLAAWLGRIALGLAVLLGMILFFDFSLTLEVLHYLTNVGPALHLRHGGTLLVDTFSQYGPAPVFITFLAYKVGPLTLGTAQIAVQVCNLAFCALWLGCLYRLSAHRLPAML